MKAKITDAVKEEIIARVQDGETAISLAKEYGVSQGSVSKWMSKTKKKAKKASKTSDANVTEKMSQIETSALADMQIKKLKKENALLKEMVIEQGLKLQEYKTLLE